MCRDLTRLSIGYLIGLIIEACTGHQSVFSPHAVDPIHITVHFLRPASAFEKGTMEPAKFEVQVETVKHGAATTNLHAELLQNVSDYKRC